MFNIGDLIIYSGQGICRIDEICEKTYLGITQNYYVLHPVENCKLKINIPVDNDKVTMLDIIHRDEAEEILESFKLPGKEWIDAANFRAQIYSEIVRQGNRKEIAEIANTLMRKKHETESSGRKFPEKDNRLLTNIQNILFAELAISMDTTFNVICEKINRLISDGGDKSL